MQVGDEIRSVREAAGMSQQELADKAKLHRTYINMVERGKKNPTIEVFVRICNALEIVPSKMFARNEKHAKRGG
jgi:transcriptional regulator with XRE-family HTH domain